MTPPALVNDMVEPGALDLHTGQEQKSIRGCVSASCAYAFLQAHRRLQAITVHEIDRTLLILCAQSVSRGLRSHRGA